MTRPNSIAEMIAEMIAVTVAQAGRLDILAATITGIALPVDGGWTAH